jgi:hypothetical protein
VAKRYMWVASRIVHDTFDDEVVVINLENGCYYSLTGSGPEIWAAVGRGATREEILAAVVPPAAISDGAPAVDAFLEALIAEGLVAADGSSPDSVRSGAADGPRETRELRLPVLQKFTDQRELLLLDPIHEVGELGWPEKK